MRATAICVWHNAIQFNEFKNNLINQKNVDINLIDIDNSENQYGNIRKAYNDQMNQIDSEYVIFCHPDIVFLNDIELEKILLLIDGLGDFGVVGVAGCREGSKWEILSNIVHGDEKRNAGTDICDAEAVQIVDECMYIMKKDFLKNHQFSDIDGFHMHAAEQCLRANSDGFTNYVVPANIWHKSDGKSLDPSYMKTLEIIIDKYCNDIEYLNTTVKQWKISGIRAKIYRKYYYIKQMVKKIIFVDVFKRN